MPTLKQAEMDWEHFLKHKKIVPKKQKRKPIKRKPKPKEYKYPKFDLKIKRKKTKYGKPRSYPTFIGEGLI